jgi:phage/plasmid-associated DNA primase
MNINFPSGFGTIDNKCKIVDSDGNRICSFNSAHENGLCGIHEAAREADAIKADEVKVKITKLSKEKDDLKKVYNEKKNQEDEKKRQEEEIKSKERQKKQAKYNNDDDVYPIYDEDDRIIGYECKTEVNDKIACYIFLRLHVIEDGSCLIQKDGDDLLIFDSSSGMWKNDDNYIKKIITQSGLRLYHITFDDEKNEWVRSKRCADYSGTISNVDKLFKFLTITIDNTNFITKNIETNIGKLLFKNGIYDFKTNTFTEGFDSKIIFFHRIERDFPQRIKEDIDYIEFILFDNLFENIEISNYIKRAVANSIYGNYEIRKAIFALGRTGSGKGMLIDALLSAFPGIVSTFDADNLVFSKSTKDKAQRNMWLIKLKTARLAISSEITIEKNKTGQVKTLLDGNLFKQVVSGGDNIEVRGMNENIHTIVNRATLMFCANDFPDFYPRDEAVRDRIENVNFYKCFKETPNPEYTNELKRDINVKKNIKLEKYQNALFWILADTYQNQILGKEYLPAPIEIIEEEEDQFETDEIKMFEKLLSEHFEIVGDNVVIEKNDRISNNDIKALFQSELGWLNPKLIQCFKVFRKTKLMKFSTTSINSVTYRSNLKKKSTH